MKRLPAWSKNKYVFTALAFGLWMLCFDHDDLITQWHLSHQIRELEQKKNFYQQQIEQAEQQKAALQHNAVQLLQFARTRYYFKPPQADLYNITFEKSH
ncbi:MAG: septum formation initiator family protein [Thermoflavifilum aggregans]|nr:septum formation initiator family protein [Thermoflavifilum aggregans]